MKNQDVLELGVTSLTGKDLAALLIPKHYKSSYTGTSYPSQLEYEFARDMLCSPCPSENDYTSIGMIPNSRCLNIIWREPVVAKDAPCTPSGRSLKSW